MTEAENNDKNVINIHLALKLSQDTIHVDFPFHMINDTVDQVVQDLVSELDIGTDYTSQLKAIISEQIRKGKENAQKDKEQQVISLDAEIEKDPEYIRLLEQQSKELKEMEARHNIEQQNLARKLATDAAQDDLLIF